MHELAERLLKAIRRREFLRAGDRVAAAVSGGADSVALLLLLLELREDLGIVLSVAHVNHELRGAESDEDARFVAKLAGKHGLELATSTLPVENHGTGIESAARRLRYEYFQELASAGRATKIATAHTLDDQAETVLLRLFRGTGIRGLAGILPRLILQREGRACGEVVRPLLAFRRAELRDYLRARGQEWHEDSSNSELTFLRNRVRQRLMPVIAEEFGEAAIEHMAELAEIARAEEELWEVSTQYPVPSTRRPALGTQFLAGHSEGALDVERLLALPLAAARRAVRAWVEAKAPKAAISFRLIEVILELARGPAGRKVELPGRTASHEGAAATCPRAADGKPVGPRIVRRGRDELLLEAASGDTRDYEYVLAVPGEILVAELGTGIVAECVDVANVPEPHRQELIQPERLRNEVVIRNWRAGDRFWPAHSKQEKKVKELLSDRHAAGDEKKLWPVAVCRGELVWLRGFAAAKDWQARAGGAVWIREIGVASGSPSRGV